METTTETKRPSLADLTRYRNLHLWMLLPLAITVLGFAPRYFLALPQATFHQHVHGISATLWMLLIIIQPWLITRGGHRPTHRSLGIFGLVLAGIVAGSALAIIPRNILNIPRLSDDGGFNPTFAYFVTYLDTVLIALFVFSVTFAILKIRKGQVADHVQWLLASVLLILSPALIRLLLMIGMKIRPDAGIRFIDMVVPTVVLMLLIVGVYYYRFGSFRHPSFVLVILSVLSFLLVGWVGDNETLRSLAHIIFKP